MRIISENGMEQLLILMGYDIMDSEMCTDSTKVFDIASDLGWTSIEDKETGTYVFVKPYNIDNGYK
jgi:hypothetical protein